MMYSYIISHTVGLYIGTPAVPKLHCRHTHADKIIQCWMCVYIAKLQLCYKDVHVQY